MESIIEYFCNKTLNIIYIIAITQSVMLISAYLLACLALTHIDKSWKLIVSFFPLCTITIVIYTMVCLPTVTVRPYLRHCEKFAKRKAALRHDNKSISQIGHVTFAEIWKWEKSQYPHPIGGTNSSRFHIIHTQQNIEKVLISCIEIGDSNNYSLFMKKKEK